MQKKINNIIYFSSAFDALRMLVGATSSIYLVSHGMTLVELGLLKSIQSIIYFFLDIPTSYLADKYNRKIAVLIAVFFGALWLTLTGMFNNVSIYFVAELFNSISLTILGGVLYAYAVDNSGDAKNANMIFSKMNKIQFLFMGISSIIGALLYMIDPKLPWLVSGLSCLILCIIGFWYLPAPITETNTKKITIIDTFKELKFIKPTLLIEGLNLALLLALFQVLLQYWQIMIDDIFATSLSGLFYGIIFCLILLAQSLSGYVSSISNEKSYTNKVSAICLFSLVLITGISFYFKNSYFFTFFIIMLFGMMQYVITFSRAIYHNLSSSNKRSMYESFINTFSKLICIVLIPLVSYGVKIISWKNIIIALSTLTLFNLYLRIREKNTIK